VTHLKSINRKAHRVTEYVKAEDLERMQNTVDYGQQQQSQDEEAFDIF